MHGGVPEHLVPPVLEPENIYTWELWKDVSDQVFVSSGCTYALQKADIAKYLKEKEIDDWEWQLEKFQVIFEELVLKKEEKNA